MTEIVLTRELIEAGSRNGGYTKNQLIVLGAPWPPRKGWKRALIGKKIEASVYWRFRDSKKLRRSRPSLGREFHGAQLEFYDKIARDG